MPFTVPEPWTTTDEATTVRVVFREGVPVKVQPYTQPVSYSDMLG
jgi:argininosuccinate synthase